MNWDALWLDCNIATMVANSDQPYGIIENAAIAVQNRQIAWIGPRDQLPDHDVHV